MPPLRAIALSLALAACGNAQPHKRAGATPGTTGTPAIAACVSDGDCPTGAAPLCENGLCVAACTDDPSRCTASQTCDAASLHCVDSGAGSSGGGGDLGSSGGTGTTGTSGSTGDTSGGGTTGTTGTSGSMGATGMTGMTGMTGGTAIAAPLLCAACAQDSDCGAGNFCLTDSSGATFCGSACATTADCPASYDCQPISDGAGNPLGDQCAPSSGACAAASNGTGSGGPLCSACAVDADCGGPGNFCLSDPLGAGFCGVACASSTDCPPGYDCLPVGDGTGALLGQNCSPTSGTCGVP